MSSIVYFEAALAGAAATPNSAPETRHSVAPAEVHLKRQPPGVGYLF